MRKNFKSDVSDRKVITNEDLFHAFMLTTGVPPKNPLSYLLGIR